MKCVPKAEYIPIAGIGLTKTKTNRIVNLRLKAWYEDEFEIKSTFAVLEKITCALPTAEIDKEQIKIPSNITLADRQYFKTADIDMLLGADIYFETIEAGVINLGKIG